MIGIFISLWNRLFGGGISYVLDEYGGAAAAYSLRKLSSTYGGSAVRVRRASDNAEQDIGFVGQDLDETALMNFVGYQNLFLQSQTFTTASWIKGSSTVTANAGLDPFGGNNATRWLSDVGAQFHYLGQNVSLTVGQSYTISVWVKSNTASNQLFRVFFSTGTSSTSLTATSEWQRFTFSTVLSSADTLHGITRNATGEAVDLLIFGAQLNIGTSAQPYQVTTSAARSGDGFVTKWYTQDSNGENLLTYSEQFENVAWNKTVGGVNNSIISNSTTAPNGTLTADTLVFENGLQKWMGYDVPITLQAGQQYNFSIWVKRLSGTSQIRLSLDPYQLLPWVDINVTSEWTRVSITQTSVSTTSSPVICGILSANGSGDQIYIWGAQLSQSTWLQPYQVTTTTAILRRDASQSTAANQPRIVGGGVIERENGKASIFFDGVNDFLSVNDFALPVWSIFSTAVSKIPSATTSTIYSRGSSSNYSRDALLYLATANNRVDAQRSDSTIYPTAFSYTSIQNYFVASGIFSGSSITAFADSIVGASVSTSISGSVNPVTLIGANRDVVSTSLYMGGEIGEVIVYNSDRTSTRADIERNLGAYYQTHWTGASSGLLDQFGGAAAAYSLRNLSSSYRGPLIRVRRSSDNAETDIGGTYNGDLDVASLVSFTGGQNLVLESEDFLSASWTKTNSSVTRNVTIAPDGNLTADKYAETAVNGQHAVLQFYTVSASSSFTLSFYAKAAERSNISLSIYLNSGVFDSMGANFDLTNGIVQLTGTSGAGAITSQSIQSVGNGWWRCSITGTTNKTGSHTAQLGILNSSFQNTYLGVAGSGVYIWGAQLNTGILQPYIPTTTTAVNGANAFVTKWYTQDNNYQNLLLQSQTFEAANWTKFASSISQDVISAPDGTLTADKLNETATTAQHGCVQVYTISTAQVHTLSFYAKAAERSNIAVVIYLNGGVGDNFIARYNLSTGIVQSTGTAGAAVLLSSSIQPVGDGWYRCSITGNTNVTGSHSCQISILDASFANSYVGVAGSGIYIWGAQLSEGTLVPYTATTTTVSQRRDAIQATAAAQPRIVNAGGVESEGNRPALFFDGSDDSFTIPSIEASNLDWSVFYAARNNSPSSTGFGISNTAGLNPIFFGRYSDGNLYLQNDGSTDYYYSVSEPSTTFNLTSGFSRGSSANAFLNGIQLSLSGPLTYTSNSTSFNLIGGYVSFRSNAEASELVLYVSNQLPNRPTIQSNINSYYRIYWQGNGTALLDNYSGASAAYSLRNLSSAYTGPLIRVRRSSDNVERDIYGTFGGDLDIASLVAFVGANSGFVTTWYDQSGNARNATQGTAANQPRIVNAGVVETENGKPTILFDGSNDQFSIPSVDVNNVDYSIFYASKSNSSSSSGFVISTASIQGPYFGRYSNGIIYIQYIGSTSYSRSVSDTSTTFNITSGFARSSSANVFLNGSSLTLTNPAPFTPPSTVFNSIGKFGSDTSANAEASELILYLGDRSSSRTAIESNINNYYKIY